MYPHFNTDYKADLHPNDTLTIVCANHPDRIATGLDGTVDGPPRPLCLDCWLGDWPTINARIGVQREEARRLVEGWTR